MKNYILVSFATLAFTLGNAQEKLKPNQTFKTAVYLENVPDANSTDSLLTINSMGLVQKLPKSTIIPTSFDGIPRSGTVDGFPITGGLKFNTEIDEVALIQYYGSEDGLQSYVEFDGNEGLVAISPGGVEIKSRYNNLNNYIKIGYGLSNVITVGASTTSVGLLGINDYTVNYPTDGTEDEIFPQIKYVKRGTSYSTTETRIGGTWINNKPIYRRVFTGTTSTTHIPTAGMDIDEIISIKGNFTVTFEHLDLAFDSNTVSVSNGNIFSTGIKGIFVYSSIQNLLTKRAITYNHNITTQTPSQTELAVPFIMIVEYTKTTD